MIAESNPTDLHTQDEQAQREKREREWRAEVSARAFQAVMSKPEGRLVIWEMVADSGWLTLDAYAPNALAMSNNTGRMRVGRMLFQRARRLCPALWQTMLDENMEREDERNRSE